MRTVALALALARVLTAPILLLSVMVSCSPPAWYSAMPEADQARLSRCRNIVVDAQCRGDEIYRTMCSRDLIKNYADQPGSNARRAWLQAHGCPPYMVEPTEPTR